MKANKVFGFLSIVAILAVLLAAGTGDKYGFGYRKTVTATCDDTVTLTPTNTLTIYTMAADTSPVVNITETNCIIGDRLVFKVTADATDRKITWGSNITANDGRVKASQTKMFEFAYDGSDFKQLTQVYDANSYTATLTSDDTITASPAGEFVIYTLALDTSPVINITETNCVSGDRVVIKVTADATDRKITWGSNITANDGRVKASQTKMFEFAYDGSDFKQLTQVYDTDGYVEALTSGVAISLTPADVLNIYTLSADTSATLNVTETNCAAGDRLILKVTSDATARTMTFGTNITGVAEEVTASKTEVFEFVYDGSDFIQVSESAIN